MEELIRGIISTLSISFFIFGSLFVIIKGISFHYKDKTFPKKTVNRFLTVLLLTALFGFITGDVTKKFIGKNFIEGFRTENVFIEGDGETVDHYEDIPIFPKTPIGIFLDNLMTIALTLVLIDFHTLQFVFPKDENEKSDIKENMFMEVVLCPLFLLALFNMPYWFYNILKWIVFFSCVSFSFKSIRKKEGILPIIYILLGLIFHPLLPIYLSKPVWRIIDAFALTFFIVIIVNRLRAGKEILPNE